MRVVTVSGNEAGQRLDKLLLKYMNNASMGFIFKMLRKKNIVLNGKKADGSEKVCVGDEIKLFLSDETIEKFSSTRNHSVEHAVKLDVIYEDEHILLINKPVGMLSQKAQPGDVSLNEYCIDHLLKNASITPEILKTFTPSVCNRLDRNTSGIVICGKTLIGLQTMSEMLKNRTLHKYYICMVDGRVAEEQTIRGYLTKDEAHNRVTIHDTGEEDAARIETSYRPLGYLEDATLLEVELITGKSHQIRAHLASVRHPIIGDVKYGNKEINGAYRKQSGVTSQLLHAYKLVMPEINGALAYLSKQEFTASPSSIFQAIIDEAAEPGGRHGNMELQRIKRIHTGRTDQQDK